MTRAAQHKMIQELRDNASKMNRDEQYHVEMMLKKDKDDEDLDALSIKKMEELHVKYVKNKSKQQAEEAWKKLTGGKT
ncbi:MAG: hypothetical protein HW374_969 [Bacteroidetes bacterium]|nr:hypothetical protein [Bacteroidota bacterium]